MTRSPDQPKFTHPFVTLDLDGQVMSFPRIFVPSLKDQTNMLNEVAKLRSKNTRFYGLTNRPPGQLQHIARTLGEQDGLWITENGASVYDLRKDMAMTLPRWQRVAKEDVPLMRRYLEEHVGIEKIPTSFSSLQYQPGMGDVKTLICVPDGITVTETAEKVRLALEQGRFGERFTVEGGGKAVDINPVGLSKAEGMETLIALNNLDPHQGLFIADHSRDIPAAEVFIQKGGLIAAVANAKPEYKAYVQTQAGLLAPEGTTHEGSVAPLLNQFGKIIQRGRRS